MKLTQKIKDAIIEFNATLVDVDFDEAHELTLDHLLDEEIVDLYYSIKSLCHKQRY